MRASDEGLSGGVVWWRVAVVEQHSGEAPLGSWAGGASAFDGGVSVHMAWGRRSAGGPQEQLVAAVGVASSGGERPPSNNT